MLDESALSKRDILCDMGYEDAIVFENPDYDNAIVGVSSDGRVIYDFDRMVGCLMDEDEMDEDEAVEFIDYNTIRAAEYYSDGPIVMYRLLE